ncbi:unnamed protein product [Didymodactylos carnosus]|uniref:Uncharacterized protein n=1 Tax=Didymodactylos carnosus TaxID=1234261 RepID=A0A814N3D6_9BILA|nr:unnamed protein product [Didymodactylos carnosus]CAF1086344.1 unnamed protein product [Didymodactylos carnosus]CAF3647615.1 unnamed protein product [Didymodactylos carnosus]CAF3851897.1 unnamed protein product [Didymodactylos carnosus]
MSVMRSLATGSRNRVSDRRSSGTRAALHIEPKVIHDEAPSRSTVVRWSKWFREGGEQIEDEPRPGRPVTKTTSENIEEVRL